MPGEGEGSEESEDGRPHFPIVGIGASAGGLVALTELLKALPADPGLALVVIQHLDPTHESMLTEILSRSSALPVREVKDEERVEPDHVYVIPPGHGLVVEKGRLKLAPARQRTIDPFLQSLARDHGHRAIGVILSGSANDGTLGLEEVKGQGGITFAQDQSAQVDSMPRSAIASGCVDFVLAPADIARELVRISRHPYVHPAGDGDPLAGERQLLRVLDLVRSTTGVDFSHYKRNTLVRRIARRMVLNKIDALPEYVRLLQDRPSEVDALYQDVLINVTSFFRDPEAFELLKSRVFPRLTADRSRHDPIRVWIVGCSTGEEAYSLAIAFAEFADSLGRQIPLQLFATDINEASVEKARMGIYPRHIAQDVSSARLRRFFVEVDGHYRVAKSIRDSCIFARHDVLSSPPFSRIDLLTCRNLLIYLEPMLQQIVIPVLHYAVRPDGALWLGSSETIGAYRELFELEDVKHKLYRRKPLPVRLPTPLALLGKGEVADVPAALPAVRQGGAPLGGDVQKEADRVLMSRYLPPNVLVNGDFEILHFRGDTAPFLMLPVGKPHLNLLHLLREGLLTAVRGALLKAKKDELPVRQADLRVKSDGGYRDVCVQVVPVRGENRHRNCFLVLFEEGRDGARAAAGGAAAPVPPAADAADGQREFTMLRQELAATREYLQSVIDQQEAANEELQSANEEVQSSNEELQSINEELETSKEEIQSTNEELATVNDELQNRNLELTQSNNDFLNLLNSVQMAIVMLGPDLRIRRFTPAAERLFNLIPADIGRPINQLKLEFEADGLEQLVAAVLESGSARQRDVRDRTGRWYSLRLQPYRTLGEAIEGVVVVLVDIHEVKSAETSLRKARRELGDVDRDKDRFLAMLAHELRNPLAPLRNIGAVLKSSHAEPETLDWASGVIDRQIHTMTRMIDDLLDVSRITRGKVQLREAALDLRDVFGRVLAQVQSQLDERGQRLDFDVPDVQLAVWGDAVRLEQVFGNLLSNASKFSPAGAEISLVTEVVEAEGVGGGRQVVTRITDPGIGMEPELIAKIFDLFIQGDTSLARQHGGLGIGLTIARQLTEMHHGTLRASSPGPGQGSTFEVCLPLQVAGVEPRSGPPAHERRRHTRPRRVLVVDDNRDAAESLQRLLRRQGHVVEQAADAEQALELASGFRPEIAVLDIGLPRIDGYELARRLRVQHGARSPFLVALSGYGQESDFKRSTAAGFDVHLVKPIEPDALLDLLDRAP